MRIPFMSVSVFVFLSLLPCPVSSAELVRTVSFSELIETSGVRVDDESDREALTVRAEPGKQFYALIELEDPGMRLPVYALKGMVRYEEVEGDAFLQLDNHFGSSGTFFTKSLAPRGPLGKISGSSDWRPFVLPFYANSGEQADGASPVPEKLTLGVFLPGSGTMSISGVGLYQYAAGEDPLQSEGQWFSNRTAGWIGGIVGSLIGIWGALIGVMSGRGKARGFVLNSATTLLVIGVVGLIAGVAALATAQPYAVYYPFLLFGSILIFVMGFLRRTMSLRYEQLELKRMQSMDA